MKNDVGSFDDFVFGYDKLWEGYKKMKEHNYSFEEYKMLMSTSEHYFDYLYRTLTIALTFFSAISTLLFNVKASVFVKYLGFNFLLPILMYIFGLLYAYNICVLARSGALAVKMEKQLKEKDESFEGWVKYSKIKNSGFVLAYGTAFAFFILLPLLSIFLAPQCVVQSSNIKLLSFFLNITIMDTPFLAELFYAIYIVFLLVIIKGISYYFGETKKFLNVDFNELVVEGESTLRCVDCEGADDQEGEL